MTGRDLFLVVAVDLFTFLAVAMFAARTWRRGTPTDPVSRTTVLLALAGAVLILVALPLPWAQVRGDAQGLASLTGSPGSSLVALTAGLLSVAALGVVAELGRRGGSVVVPLVSVAIGMSWSLVALNSLLLTSGVNRAALDGSRVEVGPAAWLCLLGGLLAVSAGATAIRGSATTPTTPRIPGALDEWGAPAAPSAQTRGNVDTWGLPGSPPPHETGDQW